MSRSKRTTKSSPVEQVERLLNEDAPCWPMGAAPTLYVAFAFDPIISPPRDHDPRQYKAGTCLGAFMSRGAAKRAVAYHREAGGYVWDQKYGEDDPTLFLRDGSCFMGYIEEIPLERRVQERRK